MSVSATITWTPNPNNTAEQIVQYRLHGSQDWIDYSTEAAGVNTKVVSGLQPNEIYEFRIVNTCTDGNQAASAVATKIYITCPNVNVAQFLNSLTFSFPHLGGEVVKYVVELLNSQSQYLQQKIILTPSGTITDTFSNLTSNTSYKIRVTVYAGESGAYSKTCPEVQTSTLAPIDCNPPTAINVELTEDSLT